ncbi:MAG: transcriptional regulator, LysR family [Verrucomicrobiaceae bacterium]|nr:transcriptional regulator, LysR family [Verrucomicrobiaceae bacterium]
MELRHLRYFVIAAEEENFRRAAERLHVAQPALSKQIALLEAELGCALFTRSKGRVYLSEVGRMYLEDVRRILLDVEQATERIRQAASGQIGTLRVGFRETAGRSRTVSRSFSFFRQKFSSVELRLQQMTSPAQCTALRAGELDAGFIYLSPEHDHGLARIEVAVDRFYLALHRAHPLASKPAIHLHDLDTESFLWLARSRNAYYSDTLLRTCIAGGLAPRIIQEVDSEATALNLVAVGMGVSFIVAASEVSPLSSIVFKRVVELDNTLTLALVWPENTNSPLTNKFVETVRTIAGASSTSVLSARPTS